MNSSFPRTKKAMFFATLISIGAKSRALSICRWPTCFLFLVSENRVPMSDICLWLYRLEKAITLLYIVLNGQMFSKLCKVNSLLPVRFLMKSMKKDNHYSLTKKPTTPLLTILYVRLFSGSVKRRILKSC